MSTIESHPNTTPPNRPPRPFPSCDGPESPRRRASRPPRSGRTAWSSGGGGGGSYGWKIMKTMAGNL